jgi:hypothetical protein
LFFSFRLGLDALERYLFQRQFEIKKLRRYPPAGKEKLREFPQALRPKMPQQTAVHFPNRLIQPGEQIEAVRSYPRRNDPAISLIVTVAGNQPSFFKPVEQPRYIRVASDHASPDFAAIEAVRRATQDSQDVVLRRRKIFSFQQFRYRTREAVGGTHQVHEDCLLRDHYAASLVLLPKLSHLL